MVLEMDAETEREGEKGEEERTKLNRIRDKIRFSQLGSARDKSFLAPNLLLLFDGWCRTVLHLFYRAGERGSEGVGGVVASIV